jgi:hypothetical protein
MPSQGQLTLIPFPGQTFPLLKFGSANSEDGELVL